VECVAELDVPTVGAAQLGAARRDAPASECREHQRGAKTLADVAVHHNREVREFTPDSDSTTDRADRVATRDRVRRALPQAAGPEGVLVLTGLLVVGKLGLEARNLG